MGLKTIVFPWSQKVLPLVYEESLSYYEDICKLIKKVNEIIEHLDGYDEVIAELQQAITDIDSMKHDIEVLQGNQVEIYADLTTLRESVTSLVQYVQDMEQNLDRRLTEDEESISRLAQMLGKINDNFDAKIEALRNELTALFNTFTSDFTEELEILQLKVNQMRVNLQGQIDELRTIVDEINTSVENPWHWELGKISPQKNVELTYFDLADNCPSAIEYEMERLTADAYSELDITAYDYARRGKKRLHLDWKFSPPFGWRQEINNVLTSIVDWLCNTMTANVYAEMGLDADGYTALGLTAQAYYKFRPERDGLYVEDGVLQSEQYVLYEEDGVLNVSGGTATETDGVFEIT